ncbi:5-oxoprolinase subunit PxpA [Vibrio sp.]|uniref:5-oxoprolinase subunit PxpA n=1 Tax=Vibrio sp. TaxID=678 RepID=UPI003D123CAD
MDSAKLLLNCDMGESFGAWTMGADDKVMPWVDMANIACGFHAADPNVMGHTIDLAIRYDVKIGAHPGYPDLQGFGRRSMAIPAEEMVNILIYQIGALKSLCESKNSQIEYVKPHGALYNDMLSDLALFEAVVDAVSCFSVPLMMLAQSNTQPYLDIADKYDVPMLFEAFADRAYLANGLLAPRSEQGAVLKSEEAIISQVRQIVHYGKVNTLDGYVIPIEADTICVHGDNDAAIELIKSIRKAVEENV